jgi:zinc protease
MRRIVVESAAQTPLLHIVFHAGSATDPDTPALNLLLNILVHGESSRLHRMLVEDEGIAISVGGFQDEGFDPGLAYFYLTLPSGGDPAHVEQRVIEELRRVAVDGVTEAELAKARNIVLADFWRGLATIDGKADALGWHEVFLGDFEHLFSVPDDVAEITAARLRDVAARIFRVNNMTVGVLRSAEEPGARQ